ncbi:translation initiation factor 2 [Streptomyces sp. Je 1-79]|uniref:translation initiation factor 2 n=1 Tax=Streptomyces sp. Je 1-79 TaxID=2943847 RepID=UPI0021A48D47|nr:translation initiation factor 2 [Streptomyces sp. Je 1-79]MCT4355500.1 translation initiation factor 2 [Streptomyces sp. Je 1-79]
MTSTAIGTPTALAGLALNPAAPVDILLRLLGPEYATAWSALCRYRRELPDEVVDAILSHPQPRVRAALARNPHVPGEVRGRVVDDEIWHVHVMLAGGPGEDAWPRHLPDHVIERMYATYDNQDLDALAFSRQVPFRFRLATATHPVAAIRRFGTGVWRHLPEERRAALLADPDPDVRASAERMLAHVTAEDDAQEMERRLRAMPAGGHAYHHILVNCRLSRAVVDELLRERADDDLWCLAHNYSTPPDAVAHVARVGDAKTRREVARREELPRGLVDLLARDPDPEVRTAVSVRPELTEDERAAVDYVVPPLGDLQLGEDPYRAPLAHARSAHPLLRRRVAHNPELPADVVALLAADDDLGVRVLLAQFHPAAPPELLLRCYLEYTGRYRDRLLDLPQFPAVGLGARFGTADDPAVRLLATLDPEADPELADALTRDPDARVRAGAARNPALPRKRLLQLLEDEALSGEAAANPALPRETMYALLGSP